MTTNNIPLLNIVSAFGAFLLAIFLYFLSNIEKLILPFFIFEIHIAPYNQMIPQNNLFLAIISSVAFFTSIGFIIFFLGLNPQKKRLNYIYYPLGTVLSFLVILELFGFLLLFLIQ